MNESRRYARDEVQRLTQEALRAIPHDRYCRSDIERLFRTKAEEREFARLEERLEGLNKRARERAKVVASRGMRLAENLGEAKARALDKIFSAKGDPVEALRAFREDCKVVAGVAAALLKEALGR